MAATPTQTLQQLLNAYDDDVRQYRTQRDTTVDPSQPMSASDIAGHLMSQTNDARQDAATGPAGYNRQWVPLLQSLKGTRFVGGGSLPTDTYADPTHSGEFTLQPSKPYNVATPTTTMPATAPTPRVRMPTQGPQPMPVDDFDAFTTQLYAARGKPGTDVTPAAPTPPTPTTTLKARATKARGGPVGQIATPDAITASPSPPGTPFSLDILRQLAAGG